MNISCIAVDDEPLALDVIAHHAEKIPFLHIQAMFSNAFEAMQFLCKEKVDLLLLDIQMPELTGTELLRTLQHIPRVVFTTAYSNYALQSYDLDAVDYLLKPIPFERFLKAINKVSQCMAARQATVSETIPVSPSSIFIKTEYKTVKLFLDDIVFIESLKDYVVFHLKKEKVQSLLSIKVVEGYLAREQFVRVHRSFIVALDK